MRLLKPAVKETVQLNNFTDIILKTCLNPVNVYKSFDSI